MSTLEILFYLGKFALSMVNVSGKHRGSYIQVCKIGTDPVLKCLQTLT